MHDHVCRFKKLFKRERLLIVFTGVFLLGGLSSCASVKLSTADVTNARKHVIMVRASGTLLDPAEAWAKNSSEFGVPLGIDDQLKSMDKELRDFAARIRAEGGAKPRKPWVLVYAHGGLASHASSAETYAKISQALREQEPDCFPIFIVWNSSLKSSYGEHLMRVRQGEVRPWLGAITSPFVLLADIGSGWVRAPVVWSGQITNDWRTTELPGHRQRRNHDLVEENLMRDRPDLVRLGNREERDRRSNRERAAYLGTYILTLPIKLVASPFIDGLAGKAWENMRRRTLTMFQPPEEIEIFHRLKKTEDSDARENLYREWQQQRSRGPMTKLGEQLKAWSNDTALGVEIDLFGHSMGTIVMNHLLHQVSGPHATREAVVEKGRVTTASRPNDDQEPGLKVRRIGYMAAACSIEEWQTVVIPYLQTPAGRDTQFYSLALHRMREASERNPGRWLDLAPRGSLLNWIDNFLERPVTIEQRTLGSWDNVVRIIPQIPLSISSRIHLHTFDAINIDHPNYVSLQPQKHGDLDEWPFWKEGYLWPSTRAEIPPKVGTKTIE